MRAQNLTISIPNKGCDKNCPYCVSRMTGYIKSDVDRMVRNIPKVRRLAEAAQVSSVLLTGKGEPCLNMRDVLLFLEAFKDYPMELQTNGLELSKHPGYVEMLNNAGLNVLALSIDRTNAFDVDVLGWVVERAKRCNLIVRATFNITNLLYNKITLPKLLDLCKTHGIDQMTLRRIVIPNKLGKPRRGTKAWKTMNWIKKNVDDNMFINLIQETVGLPVIRSLPYDAVVYDADGIALTFFDYCIQDTHGAEDIRSLIFMEDGHLYTAWNSRASILF